MSGSITTVTVTLSAAEHARIAAERAVRARLIAACADRAAHAVLGFGWTSQPSCAAEELRAA